MLGIMHATMISDRPATTAFGRSCGEIEADSIPNPEDSRPRGGDASRPGKSDAPSRLVRIKPAVASSDHRPIDRDIAIDEGSGSR